jgi:hypothetical protein
MINEHDTRITNYYIKKYQDVIDSVVKDSEWISKHTREQVTVFDVTGYYGVSFMVGDNKSAMSMGCFLQTFERLIK